MSIFFNPYFLISVILFSINQTQEKALDIFLPFIHAHLDDLLAMPVILGITLQIYRWIHPLRDHFRFKKEHILVAFLYISIVFEGFLPWYSDLYIRDFLDILGYAVGALVFYFKINNQKINYLLLFKN